MKIKELINEADDLITKAEEFATKKHKGQTRKFSGEPYIVHPKQVAKNVAKAGGSDEQIAAAWLHDTIEDTATTYKELVDEFGSTVAKLVKELTSPKIKDKSKKGEIYAKEMNAMSSKALDIKWADRAANVSNLSSEPEPFATKYAKETRYILDNVKKGNSKLRGMIEKSIARVYKKYNLGEAD